MATYDSLRRSSARFEFFHIDLSSGELFRSGARVPIQDQPLQVLRLLLQAEGKVVTAKPPPKPEEVMNCLYYLAPTLGSTHQITDDLHAAGVRDFFLHVISKDESGLGEHHIHSSNYLETLDVIRDGFIGAALGFIAGVIGAGLVLFFEPFGRDFPRIILVMLIAVAEPNAQNDSNERLLDDPMLDFVPASAQDDRNKL